MYIFRESELREESVNEAACLSGNISFQSQNRELKSVQQPLSVVITQMGFAGNILLGFNLFLAWKVSFASNYSSDSISSLPERRTWPRSCFYHLFSSITNLSLHKTKRKNISTTILSQNWAVFIRWDVQIIVLYFWLVRIILLEEKKQCYSFIYPFVKRVNIGNFCELRKGQLNLHGGWRKENKLTIKSSSSLLSSPTWAHPQIFSCHCLAAPSCHLSFWLLYDGY